LNLEGVSTVLVYGVIDADILLSARSTDLRVNLGEVMQSAFGIFGQAGGSKDKAGARIPLGLFADEEQETEELIRLISKRVSSRFFEAMHLENAQK
jgi:nanoRNase/pAp phosphatase (c-di-AMP/oligoRNAs hydrolase)